MRFLLRRARAFLLRLHSKGPHSEPLAFPATRNRVDIECPFCHHELFHALMVTGSGRDDRYCPHCFWAVDPLAIDWGLEGEFHAVCRCGRATSGVPGTPGHPGQATIRESKSRSTENAASLQPPDESPDDYQSARPA
jgi:hypothetical protein